MIFDFILSIVAFLLAQLVALLPTITVFPTTLATQIASFMGYINGWAWMFPVSTLLAQFTFLVLLVFVEFTYFTAMYVFSIIHSTIRG